jgi:hypothetical protein
MLGLSMMSVLCKMSSPCSRPWSPVRLWDVDDPTFSRKFTQMTLLLAWRAGRLLDDTERLTFLLCCNTGDHNILVTWLRSGTQRTHAKCTRETSSKAVTSGRWRNKCKETMTSCMGNSSIFLGHEVNWNETGSRVINGFHINFQVLLTEVRFVS